MRKDMRVVMDDDDQELIIHPKFFLHLHTSDSQIAASSNGAEFDLAGVRKNFNIVRFDYDSEALEKRLLEIVMESANFEEVEQYHRLEANIETLERSVAERKEGVLEILLSAGQDFLDDQSLVSGLKEAKAKVFESLNELVAEKKILSQLEESNTGFRTCAKKIKCFIDLCGLVKKHDCSFDFLPGEVFIILERIQCRIGQLSGEVFDRCLTQFTLSLHREMRVPFCTFARLIQISQAEQFSKILNLFDNYLLHGRSNKEPFQDFIRGSALFENYTTHDIDSTARDIDKKEESVIQSILETSVRKPILLLNDTDRHVMASTEFVYYLSLRAGVRIAPKILPLSDKTGLNELRSEFKTSRRLGRWLVLENPGPVASKLCQMILGGEAVNEEFRLFAFSHHNARVGSRIRSVFQVFSIVLPGRMETRIKFLESLIARGGEEASRAVWDHFIRFHLAVSLRLGFMQPAKLIDIMVAKCGRRRAIEGDTSSKVTAEVAFRVYSEKIGLDELEDIWRRTIVTQE